jgi:hypothetical protein
MNIQKGKRDKTGHMPVEAPAKGTFAAQRMKELREAREKYNVNFLGYYQGGLPQKKMGRIRRNNKGSSMGTPGEFHLPKQANFIDNYHPEATFVTSEDALKFKNWMRTDEGMFK